MDVTAGTYENMKIDVVVDASGNLVIASDRPFKTSEKPSWIELDEKASTLNFYNAEGVAHNLGRTLKSSMIGKMKKAKEAHVLGVHNGMVVQNVKVSMILNEGRN